LLYNFDISIHERSNSLNIIMTLPTFPTLLFTIDSLFAHITLNRPEVRNAMNAQMVLDLIEVFDMLAERQDVRAVALSGAGGTFCAGGDIKELAATLQSGGMEANPTALDTLLRKVNQAPQVVIARVEGAAMGGGFGLVCVSDIAIARTDTKFGLPEVRLGIVPALISPYVIQRLGLTRARELMLTGRRFSGDEAKAYGLVHEVYLPNDLDDHIEILLDEIRQCSPTALAACKRLIFEVSGKAPEETANFRAELLGQLRMSEEGQEGMIAFAQKRQPKWAQKEVKS
jgi:isohexenylglutaconyl-CoA hydratase